MRTIDELPLPSFTTMSFELQKDSLRLPTYRESILVRFHPYPQTRRKNVANPLMQTVDYRSQPQETVEQREDDTANLERVLEDVEGKKMKRKRSLTSLIIDLAFAVRNTRILKRRS
ncbi:hypothetical protein C8Q76DRAFT_695511 [Earliella scabrosa]|nr:hypothetical protein C8Q76DRAFT_695511 [Earliella scabrosa]